MLNAVEGFYIKMVADACDSIAGTKYNKILKDMDAADAKLEEALTLEQKLLYCEAIERASALRDEESLIAYKGSFLEGYATGVMGATYYERMKEAQQDD
ncbi:MAG: hypothetical protein LBI74_06580 [Synergistaceae bacterium]|jgi:hypothetical protein|nr:hypothetical protein [Synergistaceae bacterium]